VLPAGLFSGIPVGLSVSISARLLTPGHGTRPQVVLPR
jgi:hypothetical protein